jgi:DNA-binding XRE family transcriptional regulator
VKNRPRGESGGAGEAMPIDEEDLPALPKPDRRGRFPALQYARISLARDLIRERKGAGLSQQRLADLAGVRQETLSKIQTGKHTASQKTIDKIMRVIEAQRAKKRGVTRRIEPLQ